MILKPHPHANHQLVLASLALIERDHPEEAEVCRSVVLTLYGSVVLPVYEALLRTFAHTPAGAAVREY